MATTWTREEMARGWKVTDQSEQVGLHPEADARLAAATTGGPIRGQSVRGAYVAEASMSDVQIDADAILRHREQNKVYRIEAAVERGPTFALVGTIAEIDARLRSGFVGVDVVTGETGKASEWPHVAEQMRAEMAGMMGRREPAELRLVPNENGVGSRLVPVVTPFDGVMLGQLALPRARVISSDAKGFEIQAIGDGVEVVRFWNKSANGKPLEMIWHGVPSTVVIQSVTDQGRGEFTVSVRRWVEPLPATTWGGVPVPFERVDTARAAAPAKPAALAAGQVWAADGAQPLTMARRVDGLPGYWETIEDGPDGFKVNEGLALRWWRYLGTREEVAAAERAARVTASGEHMVAKARERADNEVREEAARLGVPYRLGDDVLPAGVAREGRAVPTPASPYREAPAREPEPFNQATGAFLDVISRGWFNVERDAGETDEALRARCRLFGADGCDFVAPTLTLDAANSRRADLGLRPLGAGEAGIPSPLAALRATIDALIAADHGPFAHARAAALRSFDEVYATTPKELRPATAPDVPTPEMARDLAAWLLLYEERRGGQREPNLCVTGALPQHFDDAIACPPSIGILATRFVKHTYERERARSDAYARPVR